MADIKKVAGYHAVDGSFHPNRKTAVEHSNKVKVMGALKSFEDSVQSEETPEDESLAEFLYRHRVAILAAFGQKAVLRSAGKGPRKPRAPKAKVKVPTADELLAPPVH